MKFLIKNKKILFCVLLALIIFLIIFAMLFFNKKDKTNIIKKTTNSYVAYIRINPSIKLEYTQTCKKRNDKTDCDEPKVTGYELLNDDAKKIFKDIELLSNSNDLFKVINLICETAKENDISFDKVDIYTDWEKFEKYIDDKKEISNTIKFNIKIVNKDIVNKKVEEENSIIYNVVFDTNGGSSVDNQVIKKGNKVIKPENPIKDGYIFIEWQLDNISFDFETEINKDITLVANWKKEENNNYNNNLINENNGINSSNNSNNENTFNSVTEGRGENHPAEAYECYNEGYEICASDLTKKPSLMACAEQLQDIKDKQVSWTNSHSEYPLISDLPSLSSYSLLSIQLDSDSFDCTTSDGWGKCYTYILRCNSSDDIYNELGVYIYVREQ